MVLEIQVQELKMEIDVQGKGCQPKWVWIRSDSQIIKYRVNMASNQQKIKVAATAAGNIEKTVWRWQ